MTPMTMAMMMNSGHLYILMDSGANICGASGSGLPKGFSVTDLHDVNPFRVSTVGNDVEVTRAGTLEFEATTMDGVVCKVIIRGVYLVNNNKKDDVLLSWGVLSENGWEYGDPKASVIKGPLNMNFKLVGDRLKFWRASPVRQGHHYTITLDICDPDVYPEKGVRRMNRGVKPVSTEVWHLRLGCAAHKNIEKLMDILVDNNVDVNVPSDLRTASANDHCPGCLAAGKMHPKPQKLSSKRRSNVPGEIITMDAGFFRVPSRSGGTWYFVYTDVATGYRAVYESQSTSSWDFKRTWNLFVVTHFKPNKKAWNARKFLYSDQQWNTDEVRQELAEHNVKPFFTGTEDKAGLGLAEVSNKLLAEVTRSLLHSMKIDLVWWGDAIQHAATLLNCRWSPALKRAGHGIPIAAYLWWQVWPHYNSLLRFGCVVHLNLTEKQKKDDPGKLQPRTIPMVYLGLEDVVGNAMRLYNPDTGRTMIKSRPVVALEEQLVDGKLTSPLSSTDDVDDKVRVKQLSDAFATEGIKDIRPLEMGDDTDIRGMEISRLGTYCEFENSSDFSTVTLTSPEKGTSTYYVAGLAIALQLYNRRKHKKGPLLVMSNPYQRISDAMADGAVDKKFDSDPFAKSRILWKNVGHKWRKGKKIYRALVVANDRMNHTVDLMYEDSYVENAIPESELIWSEAQREELLMASLSRVDDRIQMMSSAELIPQRAPCAINRCVCSRRGEFKHLSSEMFRNPVLTAEKASQGMIPVPYSYVELLGWPEGPHRDKFLEAHNKEMTEIFNPLVGSSVPLSAATDAAGNLSGSRMIYEIKFQKDTGALDKYKARFVVLGYTQQHGVDFWHTFAATPQRSTLRLAITLAKRFDLKLYKLDVKTAFLQGEMDYNLYCRMPEGMREYQDGVEMVYFLHKAIYGTKQAALRFYIRLRDVLVQFRYKGMWLRQSSVEPCLYFLVDNSGRLYGIVGVHVDDQIVGMQDEQMYKAFMEHLTRDFKMTEAPANEILGVTINELPDGSTILHRDSSLS